MISPLVDFLIAFIPSMSLAGFYLWYFRDEKPKLETEK